MSHKFSRRCLMVAVASVALTGVAASVPALNSWAGYHCARTANPFRLRVGNTVSSVWAPALVGAVSDWSASDVVNMTSVSGLANPTNCRGTNGRVEVCNSTYGNNGWLGLASISITDGTHITKGTVKLNDTYFSTSTYNTSAWRALVTCQEVGHTLGLDHQDENPSNGNLIPCMDYTNSPDSNQHPNTHDYADLDIIYSHLDSSTTLGQAAADSAAAEIDHNAPRTWGQLVKVSNDGRTGIYELSHGGGRKTATS